MIHFKFRTQVTDIRPKAHFHPYSNPSQVSHHNAASLCQQHRTWFLLRPILPRLLPEINPTVRLVRSKAELRGMYRRFDHPNLLPIIVVVLVALGTSLLLG